MQKLIKVSAIFGILLIGIITGLSNYMLNYSLLPEDDRADTAKAFSDFKQRYPQLTTWLDSVKAHHVLRDTTLLFPNGLRGHAYYLRGSQAQGRTAIIVHGYKDCAIKFLNLAHLYHHELGYNVLLPDLYAHGLSDGTAIQMGWKDTTDVVRWLHIAEAMFRSHNHESQMCLHGTSMGAATIMNVSRNPQPEFVKAFIADCGYTSVWDEFSVQIKEQFSLPKFPILYAASLLCDWKYGWNFQEASPLESVKNCQLPMFFIHGTADDFVPTEMVHRLYAAKPEPKSIWLAPDAAHALSYKKHPETYTRHIRNFLSPYIKE